MTPRLNLVCLILTIIATCVWSESQSSNTCRILDNVANGTIKYDFGNLSNADVEVRDNVTNATITLRLCSPLQNTLCGGKANSVSICMKKDGQETVIGKPAGELKLENNTLHFNFNGDKCGPDKNYTVQILMKCNYLATDDTGLQSFPIEKDQCALTMIWNTKLACGPETKTDCTVTDGSKNIFDLSPLTGYSRNHHVNLDDEGDAKMLLNVCHSIIIEDGAACPHGTGACMANSSVRGQPTYESYGEPAAPVIDSNGTLKIVYKTKDPCHIHSNGSNLDHRQTTISFICDPEATTDTEAELAGDSKPCDYKFIWRTNLACNKTFLNQYEANKCTAENPDTKEKYNFQQLMNQTFTATSANGTKYLFRVCGRVVGSQCAEGTGICDTNNSASAGTANSNLRWQHGGPYLNYTDGKICGNGQKRHTLIAFFCGADGSDQLPIVVKDEDCSLIIHWYRQEACKKRISCAQDLLPLIRKSKNVIITDSGKEYHINVCNSLVPTPDLACPHGSAVCQAVKNSKGQYINETSLGFPDENPVSVDERIIILNYSGGSQCPENPKKNLSSSFKFICNYTTDSGEPKYKNYADCHYDFEWGTSTVCGGVIGEWIPPCTIRDRSRSYELDLSSLYQKQIPRYVEGYGKNYSISICGGKDHCNGSAVCQGTNGYGTLSHVTVDYSAKLIKLQSNGAKCSNESYASELILFCNKTAGIGDPVLKMKPNCIASFDWQTNVACIGASGNIEPDALLTTEKISTDSNKDTSAPTWIVSSTIILVIVVLGIWVFLRYPQRCSRLKSRISAITSTQNHSRIQYSRVNTTEEARLLLDASDPCNTDGHVDSDDELLGV